MYFLLLLDPTNKNTEEWWREMQSSGNRARIENTVEDSLLWWPKTKESNKYKRLERSVEALKRSQCRDEYRGTDLGRAIYENAVFE